MEWGEQSPQHWDVEEGLASEVTNFSVARNSCKRRIDEALVVHRQKQTALFGNGFAVVNAEVKAKVRYRAGEVVGGWVDESHNSEVCGRKRTGPLAVRSGGRRSDSSRL